MKLPNLKHYVLDAEHHVVEVDVMTWAMWFETIGNRTIGYTEVTSEIHVSTVFLGIDHRHWGDGPPILFETLIFGGPLNGQGMRYASYDDAETGHKTFVRKAREAIGQKVNENAQHE
jgi:hypothetical protein